MFCRKALFLAGLTLCVSFECIGQVVTSAQNGYWHEPSTWSGGTVPSLSNCSYVRVAHPVQISTAVEAPSIEIISRLEIESSGELDIVPPEGGGEIRVLEGGLFLIGGTLVGNDLVSYYASPASIQFGDGSRFNYRGASRGFIPIASWHPNSTLIVNGFSGSGYIAIAYSDSWKQEFGNVIWDCPSQISFVDLNGYLRNIRGDLVVRNTNNQTLRLSTTQKPVIHIGGDFRIEGPSEVWVTTVSDSTRVHVGGDFEYYSTSSGPSYFTTRGRCYFEVGGAFRVDATGPLRICSGSADSTGVRKTTFVLHRGMSVSRGAFIAPFPGSGILIFTGNDVQDVSTITGAFSGNLDFYVNTEAVVDFNQSEISTQGMLRVRGHVRVGSSDPVGALQKGGGGNFQTTSAIVFYPGSTLEYDGSAAQFVSSSSPSHSGVNVIMNNPHGVSLLGDLIVDNLTVASGTVDLNLNAVKLDGDLTTTGSSVSNGDVVLTGEKNTLLYPGNSTIRDLILEKKAGTEVGILAPLSVRRTVSVLNQGITLKSNGHLTLVSSGDDAGATARVGPIPSGSLIEGDVTVQRFMSGEGRLYRYISSPVEWASVASLQDDFAVTGPFLDPSSGPGIDPASPSLYYYLGGWQPFPNSGYAADNRLQPGRGYAAFVRGNTTPVLLDFTGRLNQGSIPLAVSYDQSDQEHLGWSLVGNPYASEVDWGNTAAWTRSANMGLVFAIRDNGEGRFRYSDGEVGDANGGLIASGQAFWVHANSENPELIVHEEAKTSSDAAFFRAKREADYIRIRLEGKGSRDEVHIRKRVGASREVDPADAIKRWNDRLTFSVLSADAVPLALSAVDFVSCEETYRLRMTYPPENNDAPASLPLGSYTIYTEAFGLFGSADILLVDAFTGDTLKADSHSFTVGNDPASAAMDRFTLVVRSRPPEEVTFHVDDLACGDSVATVRLKGGALHRGHVVVLAGDHEYVFDDFGKATIPLRVLENNPNPVSAVARNICQQIPLGEMTINPLPLPEAPVIHTQSRCGPGPVLLSVQNALPDTRWFWYDDAEQQVCVFLSDTQEFHTPDLQKSKTYYAVAENELGCRSQAIPAKAIVIPADTFYVWEDRGLLYSSVSDTEWHGQGKWLHTGISFEPSESGVYTALVRMSECVFEKSITFGEMRLVEFFPVPFNNLVNVVSGQTIQRLEVHDIFGKAMLNLRPMRNAYTIETSNWPGGIYLVSVEVNDSILVRRKIVKR